MRSSGRSTLLTTTIGRRPSASALPVTNLVCGIAPSELSTSRITPSTIDRMRSTSPPKSAWPGVSTMLMRMPFHSIEVGFARMVIPRSFSRSFESIARSSTRWLSRNVPDWRNSWSTSVVLPWSTWAMIAILRRGNDMGCFPLRIGREPTALLRGKRWGCMGARLHAIVRCGKLRAPGWPRPLCLCGNNRTRLTNLGFVRRIVWRGAAD